MQARAARVRGRPPAARSIAAAALTLPALALVLLAFVLGLRGGGVTPEQWLPVALAPAVAVGTLAAVGAMPAVPRRALPALAAMGGLVLWAALSLTWSQAPDATVEVVARLALLALALAIGATCTAQARGALALAVTIGAGGAAIAIVVLARLLAGHTEAMLVGRLSYPINYANGTAALLFVAVPVLVAIAAARPLRPLARGGLGALAALVLAVGCTAESRGGTVAIVAGLVAVPVLARDRGRAGLTALAVAAPVVLALPVLAGSGGGSAGDIRDRGLAALAAAVVAGAAVGVLALLDRRGRPPFGGREGRTALAAVLAAFVLAAGLAVVETGNPLRWTADRWEEFTTLEPVAAPEDASRFGSATSNRYDYWRVAAGAFADHPLGGVGAGAFAVPWFREREVEENVTDAHSWVAASAAELGIVGLALSGAVFALALAGAWRARSAPGVWPIAAAGLGGAAVYYVLHAGVDWLGRIPAVSIPAFVALGALATGGQVDRLVLAGGRTRLAMAGLGVVVAAAVLPLYVASTVVVQAQERAVGAATALDDLDRAASLNPWAVDPLIVESTIRAADGDAAGALQAAEEAVDRGPRDWTAWVVLAEARLLAGDAEGARAAVVRVEQLNPRAAQLPSLRAAVG